MNIFKNSLYCLILALIGFAALFLVLDKQKIIKITADGNSVEASRHAISVFDSSNSLIFLISPLNDYFYKESNKKHLLDKLEKVDSGSFKDQLLINFNGLFLNAKLLVWNTSGVNTEGKAGVNYKIEEVGNGIKIVRSVSFEKKNPSQIGQILKYCTGCVVADDKKRVFFNEETITTAKTALAEKLKLTIFVLSENEFFLPDSQKIYIIGYDGVIKAEIDTKESEVFLEEKWNLLEFKTSTNGKNFVNQLINITI